MTFLIIDTSTERSILALALNKKILFEVRLPFGYQSSKYLFSSLIKLLDQAKISLKNLTAIAIGTGPGSYTGIRTGVSAAKGLSYASGIPLIEISSFKAFCIEGLIPNLSIIDAKMGGVYVYSSNYQPSTFAHSQKMSLEKLELLLPKKIHLISPDSRALQKKMSHQSEWVWIDEYPNAATLSDEVHDLYLANQLVFDIKINY